MVFSIVAPPNPRGPLFEQTWIYIISESFHVNMTSSRSMVRERKIFKWPHPIFVIISPLKRTWPFLKQFRIPFTQGFNWNWPSGSEDLFFLISVYFYQIFWYFLPLGKGVPLHLNNSNPLTLRMICANFGYNWPSGSGEEVENVKI
jgi:hypothetical protein